MKKQIEAFKNYLINDKKSSSNTVESYLRDLLQFSTYCASIKISNVQKVKTDTINGYMDHLTNQGKSDATGILLALVPLMKILLMPLIKVRWKKSYPVCLILHKLFCFYHNQAVTIINPFAIKQCLSFCTLRALRFLNF